MRTLSLAVPSLLLAGCPQTGGGELPGDWYDRGSDYDVSEPVLFTDQPYTVVGATAIADLPVPPDFATLFAEGEPLPSSECEGWDTTSALPVEITGIVTLHPRFYFKTGGCSPGQPIDEDEKYYGSYFVQDATGGYFVLGDSKVAHFDMGDRVTLRVRAVKESFDQTMISAHDVVEIQRGPEPIYYERATSFLGPEHVSRVVRVRGVVANVASTFGEIYLCNGPDPDFTIPPGGERPLCVTDPQYPGFKFSLDAELSRRGVGYEVGTLLEVTGPVLYSFSEYTVVVMRVGQITEL